MPKKRQTHGKTLFRSDGHWYGKLWIARPDGTRRQISRQALNKTHAKQVADELEAIYCAGGEEALDASSMTMAELIVRFKAAELKPAVYLGDRKVSGYKHPDVLESRIKMIGEYWSQKRIAEITPQDLRQYRDHLITTPTQHDRPRTIHDVNTYLGVLRLLLNFAKRSRWIQSNPFELTRNLINVAAELPRSRAEQPGEIERLLAQCTGRRAHLRPWIVCAIETALRPGEIDRIARMDIDWDEGVIKARATNTKTNRYREVPLTATLERELRDWLERVDSSSHWSALIPEDDPEAKIFGGIRSNKKAFHSACKDAGIEDLQRKDLRKWATTRMVRALHAAGMPDTQTMVITGHSQFKTFQGYVITDRATVQAARDALDAVKKKGEQKV
jgi:integrase